METLEVQAKDFLVKWVTAQENGTLLWQIKPLKRSVNFAIYRKNDIATSTEEQAPIAENGEASESSAFTPPTAPFTGFNGSSSNLESPSTTSLERQGLLWAKSRRMRLSLMASVNNITERGSIKTKSRSSTLSTSLTSSDLELVKNYHKLVPGELVKGLIDTFVGGTFAFVVDNTFSKTTSKTVLFSSKVVSKPESVTVDQGSDSLASTKIYQIQSINPLQTETEQKQPEIPVHKSRNIMLPKNGEFMQGVLLKKRRKKLQGFTKRFFILNFRHATLSYFKINDNKLRGQMPIVEAIVSANEKSREIFIDSGMEVWTLKAPSNGDFRVWIEAFNQLKKSNIEVFDEETRGPETAGSTALLGALRDLHLDLTDALQDFKSVPREVLESQFYTFHSRFSNILKMKGPDTASIFSDGEFFDANDYMAGAEPGVVLVNELSRRMTNAAISDDEDLRLSSDLDSESEGEKDSDEPITIAASTTRGTEKDLSGDTLDLSPLPIDGNVDRPCDIPIFTHDPPSFLSFVRKNVGKDLSTLSMPVDMNEPITILQKYAEIMEYSEMIDNALQGTYPPESGEMILRVAAFSVTYLSAFRAKMRVGRKPFNPLLGETFELVREDKGFRFLCEKVSHKPPVFGVHVESADWIFTFSPAPSQKFWGKTSEIYTSGTAKLTIRATNETFTWSEPTCVIKNIIAGEKYTEPCSSITVKSSTGQKAVVEFAKAGMFSGRSEDLVIKAYDPSKKLLSYTVTGKWTESMTLKTHTVEKEIWTAGALLPNYEKKFGFPEFTGTLNKITSIEKDKLPPTDSRYRPDMKVYVNGEIEKAEELKHQLEDGQRERRKVQEESGQPYVPRYFKHVGGDAEDPCSGHWEYIEGESSYWERRKTQNWDESHRLW